MRVLLLGATGFIGSAVLATLRAAEIEVVAVVRRRDAAAARLQAPLIAIDIARATRAEDWLPHLHGVDAVVNCAGVLQDSPRDSTRGVHAHGVGALFTACEQAGVRRVIHFSAIGVDRETPTEFSRTKVQGDEALMQRDLDWVILRPSVVVGRAAYGGSALFRGAAALPVAPIFPDAGPLQIVQRDDVARAVLDFIRPDAPARVAVELAGPRRWRFDEIVDAYRRWLGWRPAYRFPIPGWLAGFLYRLGDVAGFLGWRPPIRSTAQREIVRGAVGDAAEWRRLTGASPQDLEAALRAEPASVQERWFAQLYFLKALVFVTLSLFWIGTGVISLGPGWDIGKGYVLEGGVSDGMASLAVIGGALADIVIGIGIAVRRTARPALYAAIAISLVYAVIGTILVPRLWIDPLGPMLKIWPIIVLNMVALAILEDR